jgi:murein DD-endopeptidase MepM/ murein hydrolase activator NlpD
MAMNRLLLVGLSTVALAGCATPSYPILKDAQAPRNAARYPISDPDPAPASATNSAAQTEAIPTGAAASPSGTSAAPPPAAVESAPLAPVAAPPQARPTPPAASSAASPSYAYEPSPTPRRRREETRLITDGRVIAAHGMYRDYEVQPGDHLDAIARDLETTRGELVEANHLRRPYQLRPGEHIRVPVAKAYVVVGGDTLGAIARRFSVNLAELSNLNDLPQRGRLTPGMYVALPAHYQDHGPSRVMVAEETAPEPRPTYRPPAAAPTYRPSAASSAYAPYTPSPEALAAAAERRSQPAAGSSAPNFAYNRPSEPLRPSEPPASTQALASLGEGKFIWPVRGQILSGFGSAGAGRRNDGIDIGAPTGSEVRAAAVGEVVYAGDQVPGFGNLVLIKHAGGWVSAYAHLASIDVHMRDNVYQGEQIGSVGETGGVSQPEVHFELRYAPSPADKARPLDPLSVLPK